MFQGGSNSGGKEASRVPGLGPAAVMSPWCLQAEQWPMRMPFPRLTQMWPPGGSAANCGFGRITGIEGLTGCTKEI